MNNSTDLFNLNNVFDDDQTQRDGRTITGIVIRLILALSTAGYFYLFGAELFSWLVGPGLAPWVSAAIGAFFIDFMAWKWNQLRLNDATTGAQIATAKIMTVIDLALSIAITAVFALLVGGFVEIGVEWLSLIRGIGFVVGVGAICGNSASWAYYEANDAGSRKALQAANLRAIRNQGQHEIDKAQSIMVVERTMRDIQKSLPQHADQAAGQNAGRFFGERFTQVQEESPTTSRPTMVSSNGQK